MPTSRFQPIRLERPLKLFGKSFAVELSSDLTLGPDTVLRAALGKSIKSLLREENLLQPLRQFSDGLLGKHKLSNTTKKNICAAMGPFSEYVQAIFNGEPVPAALEKTSDWSTLATTWGLLTRENAVHVVVQSFIALDQFMEEVADCTKMNPQAGEQMFQTHFMKMLPAWHEFSPSFSIHGYLRIESSLYVMAEMEKSLGTVDADGKLQSSVVESYLEPKMKPLGHWLRDVGVTVKCANNKELADLLARRRVLHQGDKAITHDTLKSWSAMKPGMLMSLEGCQSLLKVIQNEVEVERLLSRFAVARFLAFLCDFLCSSAHHEAPKWSNAQQILLKRYQKLVAVQR